MMKPKEKKEVGEVYFKQLKELLTTLKIQESLIHSPHSVIVLSFSNYLSRVYLIWFL